VRAGVMLSCEVEEFPPFLGRVCDSVEGGGSRASGWRVCAWAALIAGIRGGLLGE